MTIIYTLVAMCERQNLRYNHPSAFTSLILGFIVRLL